MPNDVNTPTAAWEEMEDLRKLPRALMGGTRTMRKAADGSKAAGTAYLPQWEGETDTEYERRRDQSVLTNYYGEAVNGLVDKVFSRPLQLEESAPAEIQEFWLDVDGDATPGDLFCKEVARRSLAENLSHIYVDRDRVELPPAASREEEAAIGGRVRWVHYDGECVIEAVPTGTEDSARDLRRARLREVEIIQDPSDEWNAMSVARVRVLRRGVDGGLATWQVYELEPGAKEFIPLDEPRPYIPPPGHEDAFRQPPLRAVYTRKDGFFYAKPALDNLAWMNASHWRKSSDKDNALGVASVPGLALFGFDDEEVSVLEWGPFRTLVTSNTEAKVQDVSYGGAAIATAMEDIAALEKQMAIAALDPMLQKASGSEVATIRLLDEAKKISRLQAWALTWLGAFNECLELAGHWMGVDTPAEPWLTYNEEVFDSLSGTGGLDLLVKMAAIGGIPWPVVWQEAKRYGVLSDSWDLDELDGMMADQGVIGGDETT